MPEMTTLSKQKSEIVEIILAALPDSLAIYLFGSWGTGGERPDSDIDIALLPEKPLEPMSRWELAQSLASRLRRDVDLVDLLAASTVMRMQVVANGERLHASDLYKVERFQDMVFSDYARLNEERREILKDVRRRGNIYGK
jgi:uncharacterized protein